MSEEHAAPGAGPEAVAAYDDFAKRHSLSRADEARPQYLGSGGTKTGALAGGLLPGSMEGFIIETTRKVDSAHLGPLLGGASRKGLRQVGVGDSRGGSATFYRDLTTLFTTLPGTTMYMPQLSCRDDAISGFADRLLGPGGLIPLVAEYEFESIELNRHYRIGALKGISENKIRQLFAPSFIDFLARRAPDGMLFELFGGTLCVTAPGPASSAEELEKLCEFAAEVGRRITQEANEVEPSRAEEPISATPEAPPALDSGESSGLMKRLLFKGLEKLGEKAAEQDAALKAKVAGHAHGKGYEAVTGEGPLTRGVSIGLPGTLVALVRIAGQEVFVVQAGSGAGAQVRIAAVAELAGGELGRLMAVHAEGAGEGVDEDAAKPAPQSVNVGGFTIYQGEGAVRLGDHDRAAQRRVEELRGDDAPAALTFTGGLIAEDAPARLAPAREWLLGAGADRALFVSGSSVALLGPGVAAGDFDSASIDSFAAETSQVLATLKPA
ncbi:MAG: hypothetical protein ACR2G3_06820 [Solirubrobacterales bacterium]